MDTAESKRGGRRPGAGRKPHPHSPRKKESRRVTLSSDLWARIDAAQETLGLTRTAAFEAMSMVWLCLTPTDQGKDADNTRTQRQ